MATTPAHPDRPLLLRLAAAVAVAGLLGSLYLSLGMGLKACPLCFYQRTFAMAAVAVLCLGPFVRGLTAGALTPLALPMAVGGLGVAAFHTYLEATGFLECPRGVLGIGSAPQQSLALFAVLAGLLLVDLFQRRGNLAPGIAAVLLGAGFSFAGIRSTPPSPAPPTAYAVDIEQDGCRRPYVTPRGE